MESNADERPAEIRGLPDDALLRMIEVEPFKHAEHELAAARAEAAARGGLEQVRARVRAARSQGALAKREQATEPATAPVVDPTVIPRFPGSVWGSGTKVLREETILNEWGVLLERAAEHWPSFLQGVHVRLQEAKIPGGCTWGMIDVRSRGLLARVHREFLLVHLDQFADYHMYVAARPYGIHLDCCRFLTVEPGFLKGYISRRLTGSASDALSAPRNILVHQDLRAWATVVHHAVIGSTGELMQRLGQDAKRLDRGSKGILEIW
jgi:hypothetical protein